MGYTRKKNKTRGGAKKSAQRVHNQPNNLVKFIKEIRQNPTTLMGYNKQSPKSYNYLTNNLNKSYREGYEEGLTKGREEVLKSESPETVNLNIMNEWNHLRLLMINRQQLNMLLIGISPYYAFERKRDKSKPNPVKDKGIFNTEEIKQILSIYNTFDYIEGQMVKSRFNLRKLYNNEVFNATIRTILGSERFINDISHAMENSVIIPLSIIYELTTGYIDNYLHLLYSKYSYDKKQLFNGSIEEMLKDIDAENKEYKPIIDAIDNNDITRLQSAIESYIDNFAPIPVGEPVSAQISGKKVITQRKQANKAKTQKKSKSKSPNGTAINGGVSL
jgi:hypothetical protein